MNVTDSIDILLIEDNPADLLVLKKMLDESTLRINKLYAAERVADAQEALKTRGFDIALLDLSLEDRAGIDTFLEIKRLAKEVPVIILTALNNATLALEALKQGAQDYLVKGEFNSDLLSRSIEYSLERKKAEQALLISEEKYKQMFYQNFFPAWIYDPVTLQILEVNDAAIKKYGYDREEFLTLTLKDIRPSEDIPKLIRSIGNRKRHAKLWRHKKKNGDIMIVEVTFFPVNYLGKVASQAQIHDVTEEIKLQKRLNEQEKAENKKITAAVLEALERDRAHLGEELHDHINQILVTSKLYLEYAKSNTDTKDDLIGKSLDAILLAMDEIRKLSRRLVINDIKEIGLKKSIEQMIENILSVKKMQIKLTTEKFSENGIGEPIKVAIYRIVQEQLTNILKHANAKVVTIDLKKEEKQITLEMRDNGVGFDTTQRRKGIGITNMSSRASLYDGEVKIESTPGNGCKLSVTLQLKT